MSADFKGRREDLRLVTGQGKYTSDWNLPGQLHGSFLRSDRAHAEIVSVDTALALASSGVVAVFTGADTARAGFKSTPQLSATPAAAARASGFRTATGSRTDACALSARR